MVIPMIEDIKKSLTIDGSELTVVGNLHTTVFFGRTKKEDIDEFPVMTIEELLQATEEDVIKLKDVKAKPIPRFWCEVCKDYAKGVSPKFWIHLNVIDHTGETRIMMFDSFAEDIVGTAATEIIPKGSFDLFEDPTDLPDLIKALVGKSFVFLLCIEPKHIHGKCDIYRVAQVAEGKTRSVPEISLSDTYFDQSSIYSADQGSLMISDGVETSEVGISTSSTPSSKKDSTSMKEGDVQSSTSKRQCSKMGVLDDVKVATKDDKEKHKLD
ncbi:uncharacterized protein LOC111830606 [Capsella rubella]|uniref:uncharacterized protein LOC111830606 n=1 Tax=Capsella rubella TaxID=81985 RepID=UPI000CD58BB7|nr:uncharacterized protein LOC111830606 [Capsella rubella]